MKNSNNFEMIAKMLSFPGFGKYVIPAPLTIFLLTPFQLIIILSVGSQIYSAFSAQTSQIVSITLWSLTFLWNWLSMEGEKSLEFH